VKELFNNLQVNFAAVELDQIENGKELQDTLGQKTGRKTVPQVFVKGNPIGGCDDTLAAHQSGKLGQLLGLAVANGPKSNADLALQIDNLIASNKVMIFSKTTCPFCKKVFSDSFTMV
jgi:glutaredoxin